MAEQHPRRAVSSLSRTHIELSEAQSALRAEVQQLTESKEETAYLCQRTSAICEVREAEDEQQRQRSARRFEEVRQEQRDLSDKLRQIMDVRQFPTPSDRFAAVTDLQQIEQSSVLPKVPKGLVPRSAPETEDQHSAHSSVLPSVPEGLAPRSAPKTEDQHGAHSSVLPRVPNGPTPRSLPETALMAFWDEYKPGPEAYVLAYHAHKFCWHCK